MDERDDALRAKQLAELAGLLELDRVCRENDLRYYLTGGTLLGAVRHRGFIPWDDDMDIIVPRPDFDRLMDLCVRQHALGPDYYVQTWETDPTYPHVFAKLRRGPVRPYAELVGRDEGFIDIFPLDRCPDGKLPAQFYFGWLHVLNNAILYHTEEGFVCTFKHKYLYPLWRLMRHFSVKRLASMRVFLRRTMDRLSTGRHYANVGGIYGYPREVCEADWFAKPTALSFEGHMLSVPAGWDGLLKRMFGDYMTPPPVEERRGHSPMG